MVVPVILLIITNVLVAFTPDTQVNWQSCSSFPKGQISTKNTANSILCAAIEVPLLWNNSSDPRSVDFFVEKIECANQENRKGQLWILNGDIGPINGSSLYMWATGLCQSLPGYDIMIPDHRGTGYSSSLDADCLNLKLNSFSSCLNYTNYKYGNGIRGFSVTAAAIDVLYFVNLTRPSSTNSLIMYGVGYGTYWLNRILQIAPSSVSMAIIDSPLAVMKSEVQAAAIDKRFNETGNELLDLCMSTPDCIGRFTNLTGTSDLYKTIESILSKQDTVNACKGTHWNPNLVQQFPSIRLRNLYAGLLIDTSLSKFILPSLYRLYRCNSNDRIWLQNFGYELSNNNMQSYFFVPSSNVDPPTQVLYLIIAASELSSYPLPYTPSYWINLYNIDPPIFMRNESAITTENLILVDQNDYYNEPLVDQWAIFNGEMLIMYGSLSPYLPKSFALDWISQYGNNSNVNIAYFPNAQSGIAQNTPSLNSSTQIIGQMVMLSFINSNGKGTVNTTLISMWKEYIFNFNSSSMAMKIVGSTDLWNGSASKTFQKMAQLQIAKNLGIGCGVLVLVAVVCIVVVIIDGTVCRWCSQRETKKYLAMKD